MALAMESSRDWMVPKKTVGKLSEHTGFAHSRSDTRMAEMMSNKTTFQARKWKICCAFLEMDFHQVYVNQVYVNYVTISFPVLLFCIQSS